MGKAPVVLRREVTPDAMQDMGALFALYDLFQAERAALLDLGWSSGWLIYAWVTRSDGSHIAACVGEPLAM